MNPLLDLAAHPVIGHRGAAGAAPENTLEALELGLKQGADALEFDVHLAACGTPVLLHDPALDRTTSGSGPARTRSAGELSGLDAGYRFTLDQGRSFPWRGRGVRIPSFAAVLAAFPDTPLLIELKTVEVAEPVRRVLLEQKAAPRVVLASFLDAAMAPFRGGGFHLGASRRGILALWLRSKLGLGAPRGAGLVYAVPDRYGGRVTVPTPRFIQAARGAGRPVHVWTVDDPGRAVSLWGQGVSGIITNFPAAIVGARKTAFPDG